MSVRLASAILVLALAIRIVTIVTTPGYTPRHDDHDYDRIACWIAEHGLPPDRVPPAPSAASCAEPGRPGIVTAYRPPGWPVVLGATYAASGALGIHDRWTAGRIVQALLGTLVVALTGLIAAELWGRSVGLIALGTAAVFLPLVLDGATLISEPLFVALELGALLAVIRWHATRAVCWALTAGALAGLATLTRVNGALLAVVLVAGIAWPPGGRRAVAAAAACAAVALLVVAPWTIRNANVLHAFVPVSTETGPTALGTYNAASRRWAKCAGCWVLLHRTAERPLALRLHRLTEVQRDNESRTLALRYAREHPGYVAQVAWANSLRLLELGGFARTRFTASTIDVPPGAAVAGAIELWVMLAVMVAGLVAGAWRRVPPGLVALIAFLWLTTVLVQSETPRLRAALDPLLILLAALAVAQLASVLDRSLLT